MEQLQGKTAFVTGAGRGIGRAVAVAYAREGMHVACIARSSGELEAVVGEIEASGGSAAGIACDVTDFARLSEAAESVYTLWGRMDVAVINAGIDCENRPVEELDADEWKRVLDVNLSGAFYTAKAVIPFLKKTGAGKIITMGSGLGHRGRAFSAPYCVSKAGLWMLTRVLAQELSDARISVNELIPGPVRTDMGQTCSRNGRSAFSIPGEWVKEPEDVVSLAVFLAGQPDIGPTAQSFSLMRRDL